jgi:uncharacterized protein
MANLLPRAVRAGVLAGIVLLALACASANPPSSAKPAENLPTAARADKPAPAPAPRPPAFTMTKAMVPMRDGVKLETVIFSPVDAKKPLPVLFGGRSEAPA